MQQTFLQEVARKLYDRYGDEISSLTLVFPSRRARLFFSDALSQLISKPMWQPHYCSMDDVMHETSTLVPGDKILLLTELYKIYAKHHNGETFDRFYHWGEILLSDFDLIDKYMIDAEMLFRNICDLKELESDLSYLSEEMRQLIHEFWSHFDAEMPKSKEKEQFLNVWNSLWPVYSEFRERLKAIGVAYSGMIYRIAVERIKSGEASPDLERRYVFVGFNALSECEKRMLQFLKNNARCDFFWDYDSYYANGESVQEAGRFLRENILKYESSDEITHDNMLSISKKLQAISCTSNVLQCKYVKTLLEQISDSLEFDKQTAIVLTDESLLTPLLHSLPEKLASNVNVTMGYPLRQTAAYSFIERLLDLQKNCRTTADSPSFYHVDVVPLLTHPYLMQSVGDEAMRLRSHIIKNRMIRVDSALFGHNEMLKMIFSTAEDYGNLSAYLLGVVELLLEQRFDSADWYNQRSYLLLVKESIIKLDNCLKKCDIDITISIYTSLLKRHLQGLRIPFSGEPLQGLQIMGILETRNLDFKNVIILSMNDDNFPGNLSANSSFIPYNLRMAYGIPTPEHHESVYAYYFYRLIQRAERVDMLYCSRADEKSTGDKSRYIYQLDYESPYDVTYTKVGVDVATADSSEPIIHKSDSVMRKLERFTTDSPDRPILSPTAFARYITCPMKFYFASVARIKVSDELSEDVDSAMFGRILHQAMQTLYGPIVDVFNPKEYLSRLLESRAIEDAVEESINSNYIKQSNVKAGDYSGTILMVKNIIINYIRQGIIPYDIKHSSFAVVANELDISQPFSLGDGRDVLIGGIADRIDSLENGMLRIVDYKTGAMKLDFGGVGSLFNPDTGYKFGYHLQTMLYSMILYHQHDRNVEPTLYYVRHMNNDYSANLVDVKSRERIDYASCAKEFELALREKLQELFDPEIPFSCCNKKLQKDVCIFCDYKKICKR